MTRVPTMQMSTAPNTASYNSVLSAMATAALSCTDRQLVSSALAVFRCMARCAEPGRLHSACRRSLMMAFTTRTTLLC